MNLIFAVALLACGVGGQVFSESISAQWEDWSWPTSASLSTSMFRTGKKSLSLKMSQWNGLGLHKTAAVKNANLGSLT
jgi:hypothetical protein